jgi:23S rRNA pseudouridine955/2504/2580 synthase/23S rRNA pseudouridine1911/1915/1917 synthase
MRTLARPGDAGLGLAAFLALRFPYHTAREWAELARAGALLVNGAPASPEQPLAGGDEVRYAPPPRPEPPADDRVELLYEDADIMLVSKPGNLTVHPGGKYFRHTLWNVLRERFGAADPSIINRLDRETSGVTLVAKNAAASSACRRQFDSRLALKKYTVFAEGEFPGPLRARGYIVRHGGSPIRKKMRFEPSSAEAPEPGREAAWADTEFRPLRGGKGFTVLEAVPHTGRLHQIRATLLALGTPVAGDKMYGLDEGIFLRFLADAMTPEDRALMRLPRQALHAASLSFRHPADGREMSIEAPLPPDMAALLG